LLLLPGAGAANAAGDPSKDIAATNVTARTEAVFRAARQRHLADPNNAEASWQFGRACFDLADLATNDTQRAAIAEEGIAATRMVTQVDPALAAGHYYLAMNLGQLARTKTLGALKLVQEMETLFKRARELDPHFDYAGPDRNLGLLYRDAPGWPTSIGNRSKARQFLQRSANLASEYPENRLNLAESCLQWSEKTAARREFDTLVGLWPRAKQQFSGEEWAASWNDWEKRRAELQRKLEEPPPESLKRGRAG
jgi:tetratricopeptide (TPR) repeat protein